MTPHQWLRLARLLFWVVPLVWSANYIIARAAGGVVAAHTLALGRWLTAALLLLPFVCHSRRDMQRAAAAEWWQWL